MSKKKLYKCLEYLQLYKSNTNSKFTKSILHSTTTCKRLSTECLKFDYKSNLSTRILADIKTVTSRLQPKTYLKANLPPLLLHIQLYVGSSALWIIYSVVEKEALNVFLYY